MSDINISIPGGEKKRLLTGGKYCPDDIIVEAESGDADAAFEAGRKAEYDAFWDDVFSNIDNFAWRFAGYAWSDYTFDPDRDIILTYRGANYMFAHNRITDLESILKRKNLVFDTTKTARLDYLFYYCRDLVCVPEIVVGDDCVMAMQMFADCTSLHTIRKLVFQNKQATNIKEMFYNCQALVNLTIGGTIAVTGLDLHWSTLLSRDSITSVINALSDTTTGMTITFSQAAVDAAFTDAEWTALESTKPNWTIALA